jgi:cyclase
MTRRHAISSCGLLLSLALTSAADESPAAVPGLRYRLDQVAEGVFCATAHGVPYYVANSVVIVGDDGAAIVDPGAGPNGARVLRAAIRMITDRPIRWVIDTHFHFDHAFGNGAFGDAPVVAHDSVRPMLGKDALLTRTVAGYVAGLPAQIDKTRADVLRLAALEAYRDELATFVATPPALTFGDRVTLWLGGREVRLLHLGRGHTAGDVVVYLPRERIVCTGDLFNGYIGYMGDAYVDEWADTLARLEALDFATVIPGHGAPFEGKDKVAPVEACLRDLWRQAETRKREGVPADRAAAAIDLRAHASRFKQLAQVGFEPLAIRRIYEVIEERAAAASR